MHTYTILDPPTQPTWGTIDDSQSAGEMPAQQAAVRGTAAGMDGDRPARRPDAAQPAGGCERQASGAIGHAKGARAAAARDQLQTGGGAAEQLIAAERDIAGHAQQTCAAEPAQQCSGGSGASAGSAQARRRQRQPSAAREPPHTSGPAAGLDPSAGTAQQAASAEPADSPERPEQEASGHNSKGKRSSQAENHPSQQQQCQSQRQQGQERSQGQRAVQSGEPVHRLQTAAQADPHSLDLPASQHSTSQPPARLTPAGEAAADTGVAHMPPQAAAVLPQTVGCATDVRAAHDDLQAGQAAAVLPGKAGGIAEASRPPCAAQGVEAAAQTQADRGQGSQQLMGKQTAAGPSAEVARLLNGIASAEGPGEHLGRGSSEPAPKEASLLASQRNGSGAAPAVMV